MNIIPAKGFPLTINSTLEVIEDFFRISLADGDVSEGTLRVYLSGAKDFMKWAVGRRIHPRDVTYQNMLEYRRSLMERLKPATVALRIVSVRRFYDGLVRKGLVDKNPAEGVRVKIPRDQDSVVGKSLTLEELQGVLDGLPRGKNFRARRNRAMTTLAALHGLRECEISNLKMEDIGRKGEQMWLHLLGKAKARRRIPIRKDVEVLLDSYLEVRGESPGGIFCRSPKKTKALVERSIRDVLKAALRRAGVGNYRPHDFRHTSASLALAGGGELESIQRMLGHQSIEMTSQYLHSINFARKNPADSIAVDVL